MIGVDGHARIRQEDFQAVGPDHGIFEGPGERMTGQPVMSLALFITPRPEGMHGGFAVFYPVFKPGFIVKFLVPDVGFNTIQFTGPLKCPGGGFRLCLFGTLKVTPCMRPACAWVTSVFCRAWRA